MLRTVKGFCVVTVGLWLVGCEMFPHTTGINTEALAESLTPALSFTALAANGQVMYSASVDTTSINMQNVLKALGLPISVTQDSVGNVRIASSTPDGSRFTLVLSSPGGPTMASDPKAQTHVAIEWEKPADGPHGLQVLVKLEAEKKTGLVK